jgi:5-hydroxyisourate hydrolase
MGISTHVLDTAKGKPAAGVPVTLEVDRAGWETLAIGATDADGRVKLITDPPEPGTYRLTFDTNAYNAASFFPSVQIEFRVESGGVSHYHVPLLLSPYGYSTYRGS